VQWADEVCKSRTELLLVHGTNQATTTPLVTLSRVITAQKCAGEIAADDSHSTAAGPSLSPRVRNVTCSDQCYQASQATLKVPVIKNNKAFNIFAPHWQACCCQDPKYRCCAQLQYIPAQHQALH
jgi:hypothetical protein